MAELTGSQEVRLKVLDLVRQMVVGEEVSIDDVIVMAAWVIDGDYKPALDLRDRINETFGEHAATDQVRYRAEPI